MIYISSWPRLSISLDVRSSVVANTTKEHETDQYDRLYRLKTIDLPRVQLPRKDNNVAPKIGAAFFFYSKVEQKLILV